ncbi:MAG: hypothetical protein K6A65_07360, partial [Succinivibrionaceae bacterium]|nr:hypothetical protein [Succinivibrionaceae bacterium]
SARPGQAVAAGSAGNASKAAGQPIKFGDFNENLKVLGALKREDSRFTSKIKYDPNLVQEALGFAGMEGDRPTLAKPEGLRESICKMVANILNSNGREGTSPGDVNTLLVRYVISNYIDMSAEFIDNAKNAKQGMNDPEFMGKLVNYLDQELAAMKSEGQEGTEDHRYLTTFRSAVSDTNLKIMEEKPRPHVIYIES